MNEKDFIDWCKEEICLYTNKHLDKTDNKKKKVCNFEQREYPPEFLESLYDNVKVSQEK